MTEIAVPGTYTGAYVVPAMTSDCSVTFTATAHDRADNSQDDLGLDDRRAAVRRAAPPRANREHGREAGRDRQTDQRVHHLFDLRGLVGRIGERVAALPLGGGCGKRRADKHRGREKRRSRAPHCSRSPSSIF